jgi:hypothetical protein
MKLEFSGQIFEKIFRHEISWKSAQWEPSCPMWTDGQTGMVKLIFAFRNCANAPRNRCILNVVILTSIWKWTKRCIKYPPLNNFSLWNIFHRALYVEYNDKKWDRQTGWTACSIFPIFVGRRYVWGGIGEGCEARGLPFGSGQITYNICMCWTGKRIKAPTVSTQLTGAIYRLSVKFIIILLSLASAVNQYAQY